MTAPFAAAGFAGQAEAVARRAPLVAAWHFHAVAGSTNEEAMVLARAGAVHGTLVLADRQTAGRGRHGRGWESPGGVGLWFSLVLRPDLPIDRTFDVTAAAALAVADTVERMAGHVATLRWPNDVLVAGRKVCGLLAEVVGRGLRCEALVLGVGLNVNQAATDFPPELREIATSLRLSAGRPLDRAATLGVFLEALSLYYPRSLEAAPEGLRSAWLTRAGIVGRQVVVEEGVPGSGNVYEARVTGLAENGALQVMLADGGQRLIHAADVRLRHDAGEG